MIKPKGKLDALLDGVGIRLIPIHRRREAAESHARGTMHEIRNSYGDGHLLLVLRLIRQSRPNRDALWSEVIGAVSDVLASRLDWQERPSDLFDAMDRINLNDLRRAAVLRRPWPVRQTLRAYLYVELQRRMDENVDKDLLGAAA